ncbi:PP2C family protein-serine/threonine phosphatase [Streptomyces anulatus]
MASVQDWKDAPAPAQVGPRLVEGLLPGEVPARWARSLSNAIPWAYGVCAGAQYGLLAGSVQRSRVGYGIPFGAGLWAADCVALPAGCLNRPISDYDRVTLAKDLTAHLLHGLTAASPPPSSSPSSSRRALFPAGPRERGNWSRSAAWMSRGASAPLAVPVSRCGHGPGDHTERPAMPMDDPSSAGGVRFRLKLRAIQALLESQRRRITAYSEFCRAGSPAAPTPSTPPPMALSLPPSGQEVLDALPVAALLLAPVLGEHGELRDALYVARNASARAYSASRFPPGSVPPWAGPVPLFERFPSLAGTAVSRMLADAFRLRTPQGPEMVEWVVSTRSGPVRINDEVRVAPCGDHVLLTWERGDRLHMASAAQRLVRTCWAEWNLGDHGVEPSRGFRQVLGLADDIAVPALLDLATAATPDSLPALYQTLYDVILRKYTAECELRLSSNSERTFRMVAEPVRIAPGGLVWAVRAVFIDVTSDRRRREAAQHSASEARREHERVEAVAEIADVLREAVLPHFQDELDAFGLEAAAVYRPDAREAGVGGDWYKARELPDGRLLIALGDARGHGLEAATLMAKLRYALAGLAYTEEPVERLTQWLNEVACADGDESTATAVIARYHPERSLLRWTCAGHPRPVLVRGGRATQLPAPDGGPGISLGVLPDVTYTAAETPLEVDDIVLMYSDGLIERRPTDPDQDMDRFLEAAEHCRADGAPDAGHAGLQNYVERLVARLDGPHRTDDATLLALRRIGTR